MIRVRGLRKGFAGGAPALQGIDLDVDPGEFIALIGPSGAGKSTLLRCLNGLVEPSSGEILIEGEPMTGTSPARQRRLRGRIGFVFQQFNLLRRLSVLDNVLVGRLGGVPVLPSLLGRFPAEDVRRARTTLERVGLAGLEHRRADTLSGGQQQRVAIARALVQGPRMLLADEPMSSLDPALAHTVMELLSRISQEDGITVITSLHVLELARRYGRRIVGLSAGRVVFDGPPDRLTNREAAAIFPSAWT